MKRTVGSDGQPSAHFRFKRGSSAVTKPLVRLIGELRVRLMPVTYMDWSDTPQEPESPYRARLTPAEQNREADAVRPEREVVQGEITATYQVRCPCGKRWFSPIFESVQRCPRCDREVLVNRPE